MCICDCLSLFLFFPFLLYLLPPSLYSLTLFLSAPPQASGRQKQSLLLKPWRVKFYSLQFQTWKNKASNNSLFCPWVEDHGVEVFLSPVEESTPVFSYKVVLLNSICLEGAESSFQPFHMENKDNISPWEMFGIFWLLVVIQVAGEKPVLSMLFWCFRSNYWEHTIKLSQDRDFTTNKFFPMGLHFI